MSSPTGQSFDAKLDGTATPIKGDLGGTTASVKKTGDNTYEETDTRGGKVISVSDITVDGDTDTYAWTTTLRLADRFGQTLYDAAYLELALRRSLPLATLDKALRAAAVAVDITLLDGA